MFLCWLRNRCCSVGIDFATWPAHRRSQEIRSKMQTRQQLSLRRTAPAGPARAPGRVRCVLAAASVKDVPGTCQRLAAVAAAVLMAFDGSGVAQAAAPSNNPSTSQHQHAHAPHAAKHLELALGVSHEQAQAMLKREPSLNEVPTLELSTRLQSLQQLLLMGDTSASAQSSVPAPSRDQSRTASSSRPQGDQSLAIKRATELVVRQPRVLLVAPDDLKQRLSSLAQLLQVGTKDAATLVVRQPGLLTHSPATLATRLQALGELLQITREGSLRVARAEPGVLAFRHEDLQARLQGLSEMLNGNSGGNILAARELARQLPSALVMKPEAVQGKVTALASLLKLPPKAAGLLTVEAPQLLLVPETSLQQNMTALARLLDIPQERAAVVCADQPLLLVTPSQVLRARFINLGQVLGVPAEQLKTVVADHPGMLTKKAAAVRDALEKARASGQLKDGASGQGAAKS